MSLFCPTCKPPRDKPMEPRLELMFNAMSHARAEILPSAYWEELNRNNVSQLEQFGYENFKRTIAKSYFTWLTSGDTLSQLTFCAGHIPFISLVSNVVRAIMGPKHDYFSWKQS